MNILDHPKTLDEAVERLIAELTLRDRARIARMRLAEARNLPVSLGDYIWVRFGLKDGNDDLVESCRLAANATYLRSDSAIDVITDALWRRIRETHKLRSAK